MRKLKKKGENSNLKKLCVQFLLDQVIEIFNWGEKKGEIENFSWYLLNLFAEIEEQVEYSCIGAIIIAAHINS